MEGFILFYFILFYFMRGMYRICVLEMDGTND